jgi:putative transcriptional regulator
MPRKHRSAALATVHETAADLQRVGGLDQKTMHKFDALCSTPTRKMTLKKIRPQPTDRRP